jgi:choline dehydrogenase-like flavoprotein
MRTWKIPKWREGKSRAFVQVIANFAMLKHCRWANLLDRETDWNIVSEKGGGILDRKVKLSRGKYLGGCSGCNGTLCIRGSKQDFDDWQLEGWSGEEFFAYMKKVYHPYLKVLSCRKTRLISRKG